MADHSTSGRYDYAAGVCRVEVEGHSEEIVVVPRAYAELAFPDWFPTKGDVVKGALSDPFSMFKVSRQVQEFGFRGSYTISTYRGKEYVIFKGYPGLRKTFTGTRYSSSNTRVLQWGVGKLGFEKVRSMKIGGYMGVAFVACWDIAEYLLSDEKSLSGLGVKISTDVVKGLISGLAAGAAAAALTGAVVGGVGLIIAPLATALVVGFIVGLALDSLDNYLGITKGLTQWVDDNYEKALRAKQSTVNLANQISDSYQATIETIGEGYRMIVTTLETIEELKRRFDQMVNGVPRLGLGLY